MQVNNMFKNDAWWANGRFWINVARGFWVILILTLLTLFIAGLEPRYHELTSICEADVCVTLIMTPPDVAALAEMGLSLHTYALFHVGIEIFLNFFVVLLACFIFWRKSYEWMGLLLSYALVLFALNFMVESDSAYIHLHPEWQAIFDVLTSMAGIPFIMLFYLFPNGRFVPRWTRWLVALLFIVTLLDPIFRSLNFVIPSGQFSLIYLYLYLLSLLIGVYALIYRYRVISTPTERQQTKWVMLGLASFMIGIFGWSIFLEIWPLPPGRPRALFNIYFFIAVAPAFIFFPATFVMSIMRYRLWDIDLLIRRTVTYSLVTALLAAVYFGGVILIQAIFRNLTGTTSQVAIVLSTLAIAALFNPLRRRIQAFIDGRFFRKKYNAQQVLADFAQTTRDEVDMEALQTELLYVIQETMQPQTITLWLKPTTDN